MGNDRETRVEIQSPFNGEEYRAPVKTACEAMAEIINISCKEMCRIADAVLEGFFDGLYNAYIPKYQITEWRNPRKKPRGSMRRRRRQQNG